MSIIETTFKTVLYLPIFEFQIITLYKKKNSLFVHQQALKVSNHLGKRLRIVNTNINKYQFLYTIGLCIDYILIDRLDL